MSEAHMHKTDGDVAHTPPLKLVRYVLAGGMLAVAFVGVIEYLRGEPSTVRYDVAAAVVGAFFVLAGAVIVRWRAHDR